MGAPGTSADSHWHPRHNPWLIAFSVMLATFMEVLDTSVANVSLPHIAGNLSATTEESTWVLTSYLIANAIVLPTTAWLGGVMGRRRFLLLCIALFTLSSALCGAAANLGFLVLARILQGASGGALQPISQAVLLESFPPAKRGQAMAVFAMGVVVAPIVGPTLGGWITDNFSWRWIFYINLPVGGLAWVMARSFVEDPPYLHRVSFRSLDGLGFVFLVLWLSSLQILLDRGQQEDWFESRFMIACAAVSLLSMVAFVARELTTRHPLVDLRVFRNRNFAVGVCLMTMLGAVLYASTAILPLFMQTLLGYSALQAGLALSPRGLGAFAMTVLVGRIVGVVSSRLLITFGFILLGVSSFLLGTISLGVDLPHLVELSIINGISLAFIFVPLTTTTMGTLAQRQMGNAAGIFNLMRNLGGSIGIAVVTSLLARGTQVHHALLSAQAHSLNPAFRERLGAVEGLFTRYTGDPVAASARATKLLDGLVTAQASHLSFVDNFRLFGITCFVFLPTIWLLKNVRPGKGGPGLGGH